MVLASSLPDAHYDVVVVGGGIAGLAAAWELRDRNLVLLEAADRVGGRIRSESRGHYWLNVGAHLFGGPGSLIARLVDEAGLETRVVSGNRMGLAVNGMIIASGPPESYPLRLPLSPGARLSFMRSGLRLRALAHGYLRIAQRRSGEPASQTRARTLAYRGDETFADYLGSMHPDVALIFRAIAEREAAGPHEISAGCGGALFALVWGSEQTLARNLIGGSALLPQALARNLGSRAITGAVVDGIVPGAMRTRVRFRLTGRQQEVSAKYVIVATPAYVTHQIVRDLPADTADALARIPYGPFVCGAILTRESGPTPWDSVYAIATPGKTFNMLFNHANVLRGPGPREPGGSLMVYGGGDSGRRLLEMSDAQIQEAFLRDLYTILPETKGIVQEVIIHRWEKAIPYIPPARYRLQPALERPLGSIVLAGDYLEFADMEVAATTGVEAGRTVRRSLVSV